jgi:hypothetical protein
MDVENFIRFVIIIFAVGLFTVSAFLYLQRELWPATSAMGFVFLLVVVLTISNYKHIKGFGFEAEMWSDKQKEAASLIDRLELLSKATSGQLALIASKLGLWDSGLSNPETAALLDTTRQILESTGTSDAERKNILAPLYERIELNYIYVANRLVRRELDKQTNETNAARNSAQGDEARSLMKKSQTIEDTVRKANESGTDALSRKTIQPVQKLVNDSPILTGSTQLVNDLKEIVDDISYFKANGRLRRTIDWKYLER